MFSPIVIQNHTISEQHPPFIIAEMSGNHNGSLDRALEIVDAIAASGAHAVKLQTYTADTMTLNLKQSEFLINDPKSLWYGRNLYELYEQAHTPWEWHKPIFDRAQELGLIAFSSAFDDTSVDFLMGLNVPCFKIASFECTDIPLLKKVASTQKPIILSTGMCTTDEIQLSVDTLRSHGAKEIILLKCTSAYPASPTNSHLATIVDMKNRFDAPIGLSDHTLGIGAAIASVAMGACVIEKHVTLSRKDEGVDAAFSLEPDELKALTQESLTAWQSIGKVFYGSSEQEKNSLIFRRSIFVSKDIKAGDVFTKENVRVIRPAHGLSPQHFDIVIGKHAKQDLKIGTPLLERHIQQ